MIYILQGLEGSVVVSVTSRTIGIQRTSPIKELWNALTIRAVTDGGTGESPATLFMNERRLGMACILGPKDRLLLTDRRVFSNYSNELLETLLIDESLCATVVRGGYHRVVNKGFVSQ